MCHDGRHPTALSRVYFIVRADHLYVHVPFCARRCVYCDFSIAVRPRVPEAAYLDGLRRELRGRHASTAFGLDTLYLGGGTPSKLSPAAVCRLVDLIREHATIAIDAEITLEANPEDVSAASVRAWRDAGINRVSLGVQSFDPSVLHWMHRTHSAEQGSAAVAMLRDGGIENVSADLIFAAPATLRRNWDRDVDQAIALGIPHLSVYGLTVESHTPLGRWVARHDVVEAPEDSFEREFLAASRALTDAGFLHYEVSNYCRPGRASRHNSAYWTRRAYGGLGPSAHEFDGASRRWNVSPYVEWLTRLGRSEDPVDATETLDRAQVTAEAVYLGLRTSSGLGIENREREHVQPWIDSEWAVLGDTMVLRLTPLGWLRLDALAADLTHVRSRY